METSPFNRFGPLLRSLPMVTILFQWTNNALRSCHGAECIERMSHIWRDLTSMQPRIALLRGGGIGHLVCGLGNGL